MDLTGASCRSERPYATGVCRKVAANEAVVGAARITGIKRPSFLAAFLHIEGSLAPASTTHIHTIRVTSKMRFMRSMSMTMPPQTAMAPSETLVPAGAGCYGKMALVGKFHDGRHFFRTLLALQQLPAHGRTGNLSLDPFDTFRGSPASRTYFSPTMAFSSSIVLSVNFS